jgi:hypothetical protein
MTPRAQRTPRVAQREKNSRIAGVEKSGQRFEARAPFMTSGLLPQPGGSVYGPWLTNAMH